MKSRVKLLIVSGIAVLGLAGQAMATPGVGLFPTNVFGAIDKEINNHVHVTLAPGTSEDNSWNVEFETEGASTFIHQDLTLAPGATTGWHTHPGILLVSVASGSIKWYDGQCVAHVYNAGDSLTESDHLHVLRNETADTARLMITFIIPKGVNRRIDQPAPDCAAATGLL